MIHILKASSWHQFCERTRQVSTVISRFMCSTAPSKHIQLLVGCIWVGLSEDYLTLAVEACKLVRSRPCGTSQIWAWEWWDRKVSIMSSDAVKWPHIIPLWICVAYDSVDLGKSREYNDNWPSQEGHDDFQDIFETREKCMIKIPAHDINSNFSALLINNGYICMWCILALLLVAIPSSLVHHGEQLFFLAPRAGDLACATFLLVGTNLPFMGAGARVRGACERSALFSI